MTNKPAISFVGQDSDALLITDTQNIITSMAGNVHYPTPTPTLAAVTTAKDDFATAVAHAADGGRELTAIKNAKREVLGTLLRQLALYVTMTCKDDRAILISSGFPTWKHERTPAGILSAPETPVLSHGERTGDLAASTVPVPNGYIYNWRVAIPGPTPDIKVRVQTTAASNTFTNLTPGQVYLVDVNVVGSAGPSDYSDSAQLMVV